MRLRHLDSNQEGWINSPLVYRLTDTGMAGAGFEPAAFGL
jgi:hypothetical protein